MDGSTIMNYTRIKSNIFKVKFVAILYVLFFLLSFSFYSCVSHPIKNKQNKGWVNENTLRIVAVGIAQKNESDLVKRKQQAKRNALRTARITVKEKFVGLALNEGRGILKDPIYRKFFHKNIQRILKTGKVVHELYDKSQSCEIIFEVTEPNIRRKIIEGFPRK